MTSLYRNTIALAYLLLCLFITSSSTRSFIRQSTEDFNTNMQQEVGAGPIQNLDVAQYLHESQEISSSDYKVSASNPVSHVTIPSLYQKSEFFSVTENFKNPMFTWTILGFSKLPRNTPSLSNIFSIGGRRWNIQVDPYGRATGRGKFLSMYLVLNANEVLSPGEKIYIRATLRVLNQRQFNDVEKTFDHWYDSPGDGWGYHDLISLADLRDSAKGFVVNDQLMVEVEMEAISSTKYIPS